MAKKKEDETRPRRRRAVTRAKIRQKPKSGKVTKGENITVVSQETLDKLGYDIRVYSKGNPRRVASRFKYETPDGHAADPPDLSDKGTVEELVERLAAQEAEIENWEAPDLDDINAQRAEHGLELLPDDYEFKRPQVIYTEDQPLA